MVWELALVGGRVQDWLGQYRLWFIDCVKGSFWGTVLILSCFLLSSMSTRQFTC